MKPSVSQVFFCTLILVLSAAGVKSDEETTDTSSTATVSAELAETLKFLDTAVESTLAKKLADDFRKTLKGLVPVGDFEALASYYLSDYPGRKDSGDSNVRRSEEENTKFDAKSIPLVHEILNETISYLHRKKLKLVRSNDLLDRLNDIDDAENRLRQIILTYDTNNVISVRNRIEEFISKIEREEYGSPLIQLLDNKSTMARSLVTDLILLGQENREETRWTNTTMIFNIYIAVASYAFRENAILRVAYRLKANADESNVNDDSIKLSRTKNDIIKNISQSIGNVDGKLDVKDVVQQINLKPINDTKIVRIKNFLQLYYLSEHMLGFMNSGGMITSCDYSCDYWGTAKITLNGCYGTARDCKKLPEETDMGLVLQTPQVDKIYTNIIYDPEELKTSPVNFHLSNNTLPLGCEICGCICDQHKLNTTRRFYGRPIKAPTGYVVTGVRFVEKDRTIFLQIEVGKLLPLGMINQTSVHWQKLPDDANDYYIPLTHAYQTGLFNNMLQYNSDEVVTGFSFSLYAFGVELGVYKKKITDFKYGHLGDEVVHRPPNPSELKAFGIKSLDLSGKIPGVDLATTNAMMDPTEPVEIKFGISSGDFGQSYVPYFDGSDVTFDMKVPLVDISFIHYTNNIDYAGFIRPLLRSIDYKHLFFSK